MQTPLNVQCDRPIRLWTPVFSAAQIWRGLVAAIAMSLLGTAAHAQPFEMEEPAPAPSIAAIGTDGEKVLFDAAAEVFPEEGPLSFSFTPMGPEPVTSLWIQYYRNATSTGDGIGLGRFEIDRAFDMPNMSTVSQAYSSLAGEMSGMRSAMLAGRLVSDRGTVYAVIEICQGVPKPNSTYFPWRRVNVVGTSATPEDAVTSARDTARENELAASQEWATRQRPPALMVAFSEQGVTSLPPPTVAPPPSTWGSFAPLIPPGGTGQGPEPDCSPQCDFTASHVLFEDDQRLTGRLPFTIRRGFNEWTATVEILCPDCPTVCRTGEPRWRSRLVVKGTRAKGRFAFEAKIDDAGGSHIANPPDGFGGDVWIYDVLWTVTYVEYNPLVLNEHWNNSPHQPGNILWVSLPLLCSRSTGCIP